MNESTLTLKNGLVIPRICAGTWNFNANEAKEAIIKALENGIRYIDTAQDYQNENAIANAIRESKVDKQSVIVSTKLSHREVKGYETAVEGINKSAIIFSGIGIDIMFIHKEENCNKDISYDNIGIVKALIEAKEQGIIKAYGVSNFSIKELQEIKDNGLELPEIVQLPHSIGNKRQDIINFCIENNIQMQSYSPFKSSSKFTKEDVINEIANKYGKKVSEVYLSYALQTTDSVVIRSLNEEHIKNNTSLIPFLSEKDIDTLNKLDVKEDTISENEETIIEDNLEADYVIDNETLLGEKKSKDDIKQSNSDNSNTDSSVEDLEDKGYSIVDDISLKINKKENKFSIEEVEENRLDEVKSNDAKAYENMKKLRASNKKEIEKLINSVSRINIYSINYISTKQSYSTTRNNLKDSLRIRIASTINEQVRTLLRLNDAERYYFYKLIEEDPLTGRYKELEKKLYENYFIKNPSVETMIKSYEERINYIKEEPKVIEEKTKKEDSLVEETKEEDVFKNLQEKTEKDSKLTITESGVSYDDDFIYYENEEEKQNNNGLSI